MAARALAGNRNPFARFISWVSIGGLALGVVVLIVVVSVMNGFDAELRSRILSLVPHIVIYDDSISERVAQDAGVRHRFRFFEGEGMVTHNGVVNPVAIYGLDHQGIDALTLLRDNTTFGDMDALNRVPRGIALGRPLASHLGLFPGDSVALIVTRGASGGVKPAIVRFQLVATFEVGAELDYSLVVIPLSTAFDDAALAESGTVGWRLVVDDPLAAPALVRAWQSDGLQHNVRDWTDAYGELFEAVKLEKVMMFVLLLLVVAVAAFNIVTGQMLLVNDRRAEIGMLITMGAPRPLIVTSHFLQGAVIAVTGIATGAVLGVLAARNIGSMVAFFEDLFEARVLAGTYFDEVPSVVTVGDVATITAVSALLCVMAAALPARRATAINPVDALHGG